MPDDEICRKIAEEIVDNGGVFIHPGFNLSNEASGDREYLIKSMQTILSDHTPLPKMVELVEETATMSWNTLEERESRQRFMNLRTEARKLLIALQSDKPVEEIDDNT